MTNTHWLEELQVVVARGVRELVAACASFDDDAVLNTARRFTDAVPPAPDWPHAEILATRLLGACHTLVRELHAEIDERRGERTREHACTCRDVAWSAIGPLATSTAGDPGTAFADWLVVFLAHFTKEHPRTTAMRAATLICADPARTWTLCELAQRANTRNSALRRQFREQFGLRVHEYVQLVRAARAVTLFDSGIKVEAIAWDVGYRSKKDLYASLKRWVDATPTELRALTGDERRWIEEGLRRRMKGRTVLGAGF